MTPPTKIFVAFALTLSIAGFAADVFAQRCSPSANKVYFTDGPGSTVSAVHPSQRYVLVITGTNVDQFVLNKIWYFAGISALSADKGEAKWNVEFPAKQAMEIIQVPLSTNCSNKPVAYWTVDPKVRLFNQ